MNVNIYGVKAGEICRGSMEAAGPLVLSLVKAAGFVYRAGHCEL